MEERSPSGASAATGATPLSAGTLSPVSGDSSTRSPWARSSRASAGTRSPASSRMMSPGTSCSAGMVRRCPSRRTAARGSSIRAMADSASCALPSWMKPIAAFTSTTSRITAASTGLPKARARAPATTSTTTSMERNWSSSRRQAGRPGARGRRFGPWRASRAEASLSVRPRPVAPSAASVASGDSACQAARSVAASGRSVMRPG
jgi:hypothetical protein